MRWPAAANCQSAATIRARDLRRALRRQRRARTRDRDFRQPIAPDAATARRRRRRGGSPRRCRASPAASSSPWPSTTSASCASKRDGGRRVERGERLVEQQQIGMRPPARARSRRGARGRATIHAANARDARLRPSAASSVGEFGLGDRPARRCAILSSTLRQGSSRGSWNTIASRPGAAHDVTFEARIQPRDHAQQRRLAAAGRADDRADLAGLAARRRSAPSASWRSPEAPR